MIIDLQAEQTVFLAAKQNSLIQTASAINCACTAGQQSYKYRINSDNTTTICVLLWCYFSYIVSTHSFDCSIKSMCPIMWTQIELTIYILTVVIILVNKNRKKQNNQY